MKLHGPITTLIPLEAAFNIAITELTDEVADNI